MCKGMAVMSHGCTLLCLDNILTTFLGLTKFESFVSHHISIISGWYTHHDFRAIWVSWTQNWYKGVQVCPTKPKSPCLSCWVGSGLGLDSWSLVWPSVIWFTEHFSKRIWGFYKYCFSVEKISLYLQTSIAFLHYCDKRLDWLVGLRRLFILYLTNSRPMIL